MHPQAMALAVIWQVAGSRDVDEKSSWWLDMRIETQMLCECALGESSFCGSHLHFHYEHSIRYHINLVKMTQRNLQTGTLRQLRRLECINIQSVHPWNTVKSCVNRACTPGEVSTCYAIGETSKHGKHVLITAPIKSAEYADEICSPRRSCYDTDRMATCWYQMLRYTAER